MVRTVKSAYRFLGAFLVAAGLTPALHAGDLPDYMKGLVGTMQATPEETANANLLALNSSMFELYEAAGQIFTKNILGNHPVILALFSGSGGTFTLYQPGKEPVTAPPVPIVYQLLKSVGHSTMALAEVVSPYVDSPNDLRWVGPALAYRSRLQSALDGIDAASMQADWRANSKAILANNIAFLDECVAKKAISFTTLQAFAEKQGPLLEKNVAWAAHMQVAHWMGVVAGWKAMLGPDWEKTYAASNTIYVARQNNVLFSVLAQFFGPEAINDHLMLIETVSFTTTQADMLQALTRIVSDRSVGQLFFGNYHLMDYELMGSDARDAITAEDKKRGLAEVLPPLVPYGSHQFPTLITPGPGAATLADALSRAAPSSRAYTTPNR
jgi:hypothetical protein